MKRFKNILVVHDQRALSNVALERAAALAKRNVARLTLVEVIEDFPASMRMLITMMPLQELRELVINERREQLECVVSPIRKEGIPVDAIVLIGAPFYEIIQEVLREKHDLVMMMAEGKSGLREQIFGSTSLHLMRKCPCPVWVMKPEPHKPRARILAAVDINSSDEQDSSLNTMIMELATSLAELEQSELHVVHAWANIPAGFLRTHAWMAGEEVQQLAGDIMTLCRRRLDEFVGSHLLEDMNCQVHFIVGEAKAVIPRLAATEHVDLIIMGTVCRTGLAGFFIGNTAENVLQQVNCSVLVLKPEGFVSPIKLDGE